MINKWNNLPKRDRFLAVFLVAIILLTIAYLGINSLLQEKMDLEAENQVLTQEREVMSGILQAIPTLEERFSNSMDDLGEQYDKMADMPQSPITFEKMFLGWLSNKKVLIQGFTTTGPTSVNTTLVELDTAPTPIEVNIAILEGQESSQEPAKKDSTDEQNYEPTITSYTYNYEVSMREKDYLDIVDKLSNKSAFYYLKSSTYTYGEDENIATFVIEVYSYLKPSEFSKVEDLSYFYHNTIKPKIEIQVEVDNGIIDNMPIEDGTGTAIEVPKEAPTLGTVTTPSVPSKSIENKDEGLINNKGEYINSK